MHRDIKPPNLLWTDDGVVKILDFGLARVASSKGLTEEGIVPGTPGYMAPEQILGRKVDPRADLWSLGVVLYEGLTGSMPFEETEAASVVDSVLHRDPTPLSDHRDDLPKNLESLVMLLLRKRPGERPQSAAEVLEMLSSPTNPADDSPTLMNTTQVGRLSEREGLVVLPFRDLSHDRDQEYFCDGLTEELISTLAGVEGLKVMARTTSFELKNRSGDARRIGDELGVAAALEGSVRKSQDRLRIVTQLLDTENGYCIWSETYDRELADIFEIQSEIATAVARRMRKAMKEARSAEERGDHPDDRDAGGKSHQYRCLQCLSRRTLPGRSTHPRQR